MFFFLLQKSYKILNLLSIDVALGACSMAYLISSISEVNTPLITYFILGFTVWIIYTLDHLLDANDLKNNAIAPRHIFHYKYQKVLTILTISITLIIITLSFLTLPFITILYGVIGSFFVGCHIILVTVWGKKISFLVQKELSIAISYTLGISIPSISLIEGIIDTTILIFIFQCFLLAFINLCIFSYFDHQIDKEESQTSIVRLLKEEKTSILIYILFIIQLVISCISLFNNTNNSFQIILILMNLTLFIIFKKYKFFRKNERYRLLGDFIFIYPIILIFIN